MLFKNTTSVDVQRFFKEGLESLLNVGPWVDVLLFSIIFTIGIVLTVFNIKYLSSAYTGLEAGLRYVVGLREEGRGGDSTNNWKVRLFALVFAFVWWLAPATTRVLLLGKLIGSGINNQFTNSSSITTTKTKNVNPRSRGEDDENNTIAAIGEEGAGGRGGSDRDIRVDVEDLEEEDEDYLSWKTGSSQISLEYDNEGGGGAHAQNPHVNIDIVDY
ncbi:unnamed protein product [Orchesella dallaii]|uniref:Uncharacterized protein n=1 Tax=Orchesella dallaii TaxID=48710 RepID=A0ABP1PUB8_9HEXA